MILNEIRNIINDVRERGDSALIEYTLKRDHRLLKPKDLAVSKAEIDEGCRAVPKDLRGSLVRAKKNIEIFNKKCIPSPATIKRGGVSTGYVYKPIEKVGIYVPGAKYSYPSCVLMTAVPASVAGVKEIIMVTPPANITPAVLYSARLSGVSRIFRVGGPQAIAALAYGTATIPKVDMIAGPGGKYTTEAKKGVYGEVGIDMLAGPSEVIIIADDSAPVDYILRDLNAQAEHDPLARCTLVTTSKKLSEKVGRSSSKKIELVNVVSLKEAVRLVNDKAPEHLEILIRNPRKILTGIKNAGAIFIGAYAPVVLGDYYAGPSHVLPTGSTARFSSGLSSLSFLKRISIIECDKKSFGRIAGDIISIAEIEGLKEHAESARIRLTKRS